MNLFPVAVALAIAAPAQVAVPPAAAPTAVIDFHGAALTVGFVAPDATTAMLTLREGATVAPPLRLKRPDDVLMALADSNLAPLRPAILAWARNGLVALRDQEVAIARDAYEAGRAAARPANTAESVARSPTRALLQYAAALADAGRLRDALDLLHDAVATMPYRSPREQNQWTVVQLRIASLLETLGDRPAAIDALDRAAGTLGRDNPYAINFDINRAVMLAVAQRYADSLALITAVEGRFDAARGRDKVSGAALQFAWVRACALNGMGRHQEAEALLAGIAAAEQPKDRSFVVQSNDSLLYRARWCMRDADGLAAMVSDRLSAPELRSTVLQEQPGRRWLDPSDAALVARVRADPRVAALAAHRVTPLPAAFVPALNHWRDLPFPAASNDGLPAGQP